MKRFINQSLTPPGGFQFIDPDTNRVFHGRDYNSFDGLENHVQRYRSQNKLARIENFREVWEHYICDNVPQMEAKCCPVDAEIARSFRQYLSGARAYVKSIIQKPEEKFVDLEEATRRANLCRACIFNRRNIGHFHAQLYTDKVMARTIGKRRVRNWGDLYTCMVCSCLLNTKVWLSDKIVGRSLFRTELERLRREPKDSKGRPLRCWQLDAHEKILQGSKK